MLRIQEEDIAYGMAQAHSLRPTQNAVEFLTKFYDMAWYQQLSKTNTDFAQMILADLKEIFEHSIACPNCCEKDSHYQTNIQVVVLCTTLNVLFGSAYHALGQILPPLTTDLEPNQEDEESFYIQQLNLLPEKLKILNIRLLYYYRDLIVTIEKEHYHHLARFVPAYTVLLLDALERWEQSESLDSELVN